MHNKKRGQVTIFLILAIIILLAGIFYFVSQDTIIEEIDTTPIDALPVKNFIQTLFR